MKVRQLLKFIENNQIDPETELRLASQYQYPLQHTVNNLCIDEKENEPTLILTEGSFCGYGNKIWWE